MPDATPDAFLSLAGWASAKRSPLAGDASARRYDRLRAAGGDTAVLMRAPPAPDDSTARFLDIADRLASAGLAAPRLLAADADAGLALLEDLGDAVLARLAAADPAREPVLYDAVIDTLVAMQDRTPTKGLAQPDATEMAAMIAPVVDWYAAPADDTALRSLTTALLGPLLQVLAAAPPVLAHRDFHAENLIWLPERAGPARIGLLDFQDAFAGPPAYDLVSLLEDARRDLPADLRARCLARFAIATGCASETLARDVAVLGAQRNLRILGIFARLSLRDSKPRYVDLIPRVWAHLLGDLSHPDLDDLRAAVAAHLPAPVPAHLNRLKPTCTTAPTP